MGKPGVPTEQERAEALAIAERTLVDIGDDRFASVTLGSDEAWVLAATVKHQAKIIAIAERIAKRGGSLDELREALRGS